MLPQLWPAISQAARDGHFPLAADKVLVLSDVLPVRQLGTLQLIPPQGVCTVITSCMPSNTWRTTECRPGSMAWISTVRLRFRAILNCAKVRGISDIVLGAIGCGTFDNPPKLVAQQFLQLLDAAEFKGQFENVVFAVHDADAGPNYVAFQEEVHKFLAEQRQDDIWFVQEQRPAYTAHIPARLPSQRRSRPSPAFTTRIQTYVRRNPNRKEAARMEKLATALTDCDIITTDMLVPLPPPLQRDILVQRVQPLVVKHCPRHAATILAYMYNETIGALLSFANLPVSEAVAHLRHWQTAFSSTLSFATLQASRLDSLTAKPSQRAAAPSTAPYVALAWQDPARASGSADDHTDAGRHTTLPTTSLAAVGQCEAMDHGAQDTGEGSSRRRELLTPHDMHALLTDTGKVSFTRLDSPGVILLSYHEAECHVPEISEANITAFLATHSAWTAFKPEQELGGLLPTDDLLLEQPRKTACPGCRRMIFLGHVTCPSCGQAMSKDVAAPATIERVSRDAGSRIAVSRRAARPSALSTRSPCDQSDVSVTWWRLL